MTLQTSAAGAQAAVRRFGPDRRGSMAAWFGLSLVPLLVFAGAGLDLGRSINQKVQLQNATDAAALAGVSAYVSDASVAAATAAANNYMAQFKTASGLAVTYQATPSTVTSGTTTSLYKMTVTATAPIANSLMAINKAGNTIGVRSTAQNPVYTIVITLSSFSSSAADLNTISYYTVPADNGVPALSSTTLLFSNDPTATAPPAATVQLAASQKIGFLLTNTTGGRPISTPTTTCNWVWVSNGSGWWGGSWVQQCQTTYSYSSSNGYGSNQYGGTQGSTHYFWSHLSPPSKLAYPAYTQNCSLQVLTSATASPPSGSCFSALPPYATVTCAQAAGQTLYYDWNDMGGVADDKDYNDAQYTVTCTKLGNTSSTSRGVALLN